MKNRKNRILAAAMGFALLAAAACANPAAGWFHGAAADRTVGTDASSVPAGAANVEFEETSAGQSSGSNDLPEAAGSVETAAGSEETVPLYSDGWLVKLRSPEEATGAAGKIPGSGIPSENDGLERITDEIWLVKDAAVLESLRAEGVVLLAEPNYEIELFDSGRTENRDAETALAGLEIAPAADSNGWGYDSTGIPAARSEGLTGKGVRVALIDSGLNRTKKLAGANILAGASYITGSDDLSDRIGHGTIIAEILCGAADGNPVTGAAPDLEIVPLKCFASGKSTYLSTILTAARDAVEKYDCGILNMSWGMKDGASASSQLLREYLAEVDRRGVIAVAAAGNITETGPAGTMYYPAGYETVIGVGGVNKDMSVGSYSQQTAAVFVCAPGTGVKEGSSGTSFATPFVTAAAALLKQEDQQMTGEDFRNKLMRYAVDLGPSGYDTAYGYGFVNMDRLLRHPVMKVAGAPEGSEQGSSFTWHGKSSGSQIVLAGYSGSGQQLYRTVLPLSSASGSAPLENFNQYWKIKAFIIDDVWQPTGDYYYYERSSN